MAAGTMTAEKWRSVPVLSRAEAQEAGEDARGDVRLEAHVSRRDPAPGRQVRGLQVRGIGVSPVVGLVALGTDDIDRIMELENAAFDASIRAERSTILHRFCLGHRMLGAEDDAGRLVGTIGFSATNARGPDFERLPASFKESRPSPSPATQRRCASTASASVRRLGA